MDSNSNSDSTRDSQQAQRPEIESRMRQTQDTQPTGSTADMYSTTTASLADLGNHINNMAGTTMTEIRNKASEVSTGDVVQQVRDTAYSITMGSKQAEDSTGAGVEEPDIDPQEARRIDELPEERIAEFLQEKHKSDAVRPSKQQ